jgi:hypothetical protein
MSSARVSDHLLRRRPGSGDASFIIYPTPACSDIRLSPALDISCQNLYCAATSVANKFGEAQMQTRILPLLASLAIAWLIATISAGTVGGCPWCQ